MRDGPSVADVRRSTSGKMGSRPRTCVELVTRMEREWHSFRERFALLDLDQRLEPTGSEWIYRDLVAHLIAWLEFAPARLNEVRGGRPDPFSWSTDAVDRFNAQALRDRLSAGRGSMLDDLDAAYRRVLDEAQRTTDKEIAGSSHETGILSLFAWCTYLRFGEHHLDLPR